MKKIMFFRPLYSLGGTEIAMLNLVKKLKGYDLYIGYSDQTSDKHLLDRFAEYATIVDLNEVQDFEVDNFITCSAHYNLVEAVKNIKAKKTTLWIHHLVNVETTILADNEENKKLDYIVTVSNTTANILKAIFPKIAHKIKAIYNVIDEDEIKEMSEEPIELPLSNELNLVTVSRVCKEKGFERMIHLVKSLKEKKINFKWFIVGGNYYKEEFERILKLYEDFKDNFVWFGFIDNPHNIVKQCDYSVLLSDDETWGLVLTEAMILGTPCISSDFPVAFEQIQDGKNGIILSNADTASYNNRINDIMENKKKYKKAISKFCYKNEEILRKWAELFNGKQK
jgi:glycosyltransferase involved in cell wall biosynthesis